MSDYSNKTGKLSLGIAGVTRSGGKTIDEWQFASSIPSHKKNIPQPPKMIVKVAIEKSGGKIEFAARGEQLGEIRHTDINELRRLVEEKLTSQHDMLVGITWEDWLEVEVSSHGSYRSDRFAGLQISYSRLKRGTNPIDGTAYTIHNNNVVIPFPKPKKAGELDERAEVVKGFGAVGSRDEQAEYSYIPATPENIAALEDMMARMETLRARLSEFLRQDVIQNSLVNLSERLPALRFSTPESS